jgi:multiple sugar transport system substrate-binding protein/sn-glycerol 3-phosphate transport system substrate-binding protein
LELIAEFNTTNEYGITVEAQNQGGYDEIRDKVNSSIAAGRAAQLPCSSATRTTSLSTSSTTPWLDLNLLMNDPTWGMSAEENR